MDFYTNVIQWGNNLLVRAVENNQRIRKKVRYEPTLFDLVNEPTGYKTLDGRHVYLSVSCLSSYERKSAGPCY